MYVSLTGVLCSLSNATLIIFRGEHEESHHKFMYNNRTPYFQRVLLFTSIIVAKSEFVEKVDSFKTHIIKVVIYYIATFRQYLRQNLAKNPSVLNKDKYKI